MTVGYNGRDGGRKDIQDEDDVIAEHGGSSGAAEKVGFGEN